MMVLPVLSRVSYCAHAQTSLLTNEFIPRTASADCSLILALQVAWDLSGSCLQADLLGPGNSGSAEVNVFLGYTSPRVVSWHAGMRKTCTFCTLSRERGNGRFFCCFSRR